MVTIDSVESRTGIDFYPDLPDDVEKKVEGNIDPSAWDFDTN
jgi:endonuclease G